MRTETEIRARLEKWQAHAKANPPPNEWAKAYYMGVVHALEFSLGKPVEGILKEIEGSH